MKRKWVLIGGLALGILSSGQALAILKTELQGQSKGDTNWVSVNLQGWQELDFIPVRVVMTGGPVTNQLVTVNFDHTKNSIPGVQNLITFAAATNVVIKSGPTLSAPPDGDIWSYNFTVDITDGNSADVQFLARLSAGAHLFVGSSLALSSPTLQIHKPAAAPGNPDLMIQKRGAVRARVGDVITYTISYTNIASPFNTAATGTQISDVLPPAVTYVNGSATSAGILVGNVLTWDLSQVDVAAGGALSYQVVVGTNAVVGQTFTNWARIFSAENDADFSNNESSVLTVVDANPNSSPAAANDVYSTDEDSVLTVGAPGVLANDTDPEGDALAAILVSGPTHGALELSANGGFIYTPATNFYGNDSFSYRASDGVTNSTVATVSITVLPVKDAPIALNDTYTTSEDTLLNVVAPGVLGNDSDVEGAALSAVIVVGPSHGSVILNANGSFSYSPATNFNGADSFTYRANDGSTNSTPATVSITVLPVNDAPIANNDSYGTDEDVVLSVAAPGVLGNDTDVDGNVLRAVLVASPLHGTVALNTNGSFLYTPAANYNGSDSFTYRANDGLTNSLSATVSLSIRAINDAPSFNVPTSYVVSEDSGAQLVSSFAANISPGAPNEVGQQLTFVVTNDNAALFTTQPAISVAGTLTFTPAPDAFGTSIVAVILKDDGGISNGGKDTSPIQTFAIVVNPVNDPPSFTKGADLFLNQNAPRQIVNSWATHISAGPLNENAQTILFVVTNTAPTLFAEQPQLSSDGTLTFTPASGMFGSAHVSVVGVDSGGTANGGVDTSPPQEFSITINGPPVARIVAPTNGSIFIASTPITILCDATDPDGTVTNLSLFRDSTLIGNLTPQNLYTWSGATAGSHQFTATATDNAGLTAQADPVNISVLDQPPLEVIVPIHFNPQSGLFEETIKLSNPTPQAFAAVRVMVRNLPVGATVYNASGSTNGVQYVLYNYALGAGQSGNLVIEYYVPSRTTPNPVLSAELVASTASFNPKGTPMQIDRTLMLTNGSVLIDFKTVSNRIYYIQYSSDMQEWETAMPALTGTGSSMQWLDNGPPKTDSLPMTKSLRVYRMLQMP